MGAGKSGAKIPVTDALKLAWIKMAISTLPLVLLKTHVYMMAKQVVARTNTTTLNAVSSFQGVKKRGRCHSAQRGPRIRVPSRGPCSDCSRGSAKPRQPALRQALLLGRVRKQR